MAVKNHSIRNNIFLFLGKSINFCLGSNFLQTKDEIINMSYLVAFGRYPSRTELKFWRKKQISIHIKETIKLLFASPFYTIKEKQQIIIRSYHDAFGRNPHEHEISFLIKKQFSFIDLLRKHVEVFEHQPEERKKMLSDTYRIVFNRAASKDEIAYWMRKQLTFAQLLAMHATWKFRGHSRSQITGAHHNISSNEILTAKFSLHALSSIYGAGGNYLIAPGGANVIVLGKRSN